MPSRQERAAANVRARLEPGEELVTTLNGTQWSWLWFLLVPIWWLLRLVAITEREVLVFRANPLSSAKPMGLLARVPRGEVRAEKESVFLPGGARIVVAVPDRARLDQVTASR